MRRIHGDKKVRVMLDFANMDDAMEWFVAGQEDGSIPNDAFLFRADALDYMDRSGGVGRAQTLIVKKDDSGRFGKIVISEAMTWKEVEA